MYTKRTSNENILGNSNNNNDKENNKPISHPPPSSTLKSKFVQKKVASQVKEVPTSIHQLFAALKDEKLVLNISNF